MINKDTKVSGILLIFSLINFFLLIPLQVGPWGSDQTIFPLFVNTLLLLVSSLLVWRSFSLKKKLLNERIFPPRCMSNKVLFIMIVTGIYAFTMEFVGYFIITPLCLILGMSYFKVKWRIVVLVTLIITLGIYFLFEKALCSPLPMGILCEFFLY